MKFCIRVVHGLCMSPNIKVCQLVGIDSIALTALIKPSLGADTQTNFVMKRFYLFALTIQEN